MTKLEQVYGSSLYELAREEDLEEEILLDLRQVGALMEENPAYGRFLATVSISKEERCQALEEAFGGRVRPYVLNFMKLLCENGYMHCFPSCIKEYVRRYNEEQGIVEVCAVTAVSMNPSLQDALREKLQQLLGKTVELTCRVDEACMGGVKLELPGRQLDGTVKSRLDKLAASLRQAGTNVEGEVETWN